MCIHSLVLPIEQCEGCCQDNLPRLRSTFKSTILPHPPTIPTRSYHVRYRSWIIYTGISPVYFHLSTCECSPLNLSCINRMAENCVTNGPAKLVALILVLISNCIEKNRVNHFEPVPSFQEMVCAHCFQCAWCRPVQGTSHQSSMQASQVTTCPTVLLAHLIYVAKCGKPTSPKNHHEGYSIDVYCIFTKLMVPKHQGCNLGHKGMQCRSQGNREQLPASNMRWHPGTHMFLLRAPNCHIWIADKMICSFSCHAHMRIVPYRLWGFLHSQTLRQLMQNRVSL